MYGPDIFLKDVIQLRKKGLWTPSSVQPWQEQCSNTTELKAHWKVYFYLLLRIVERLLRNNIKFRHIKVVLKGQEVSENHNQALPQGLPTSDMQRWSSPRWVDILLSSALAENNIRQPHLVEILLKWNTAVYKHCSLVGIRMLCLLTWLNHREKCILWYFGKKSPCFLCLYFAGRLLMWNKLYVGGLRLLIESEQCSNTRELEVT